MGSALDSAGIFIADGQRLFHHHRDFVFGADFDGAAMVISVGVDEDSLRMRSVEHFVEVGVIETGVEMKIRSVTVEEFAVRFGDANDFNVVAIFDALEESVGVSVGHAGDGDAQRGCGRIGGW